MYRLPLYPFNNQNIHSNHRNANHHLGLSGKSRINPDRAGEILIATGQRPPGLAATVYHSVDGGHIWGPVLDPVLLELYERVPVVFFAQGGAWIATEKGQVFRADAGQRNGDPDPKGNLGSWSLVHELPTPVKVASAGGSPSSISSGFADWF